MNPDQPTDELKTIVVRLEGKVDTLAERVQAGDKHSELLVQMVTQQLGALQQSVSEMRTQISDSSARASSEASRVRSDLERQIKERTDEGERIHVDHKQDLETLLNPATGVFARLSAHDSTLSSHRTALAVISGVGTLLGGGCVTLLVRAFGG